MVGRELLWFVSDGVDGDGAVQLQSDGAEIRWVEMRFQKFLLEGWLSWQRRSADRQVRPRRAVRSRPMPACSLCDRPCVAEAAGLVFKILAQWLTGSAS